MKSKIRIKIEAIIKQKNCWVWINALANGNYNMKFANFEASAKQIKAIAKLPNVIRAYNKSAYSAYYAYNGKMQSNLFVIFNCRPKAIIL